MLQNSMLTLKKRMSQKAVSYGGMGGKWEAGIPWEAVTLVRGNPHSLDEGRAGVVGEVGGFHRKPKT